MFTENVYYFQSWTIKFKNGEYRMGWRSRFFLWYIFKLYDFKLFRKRVYKRLKESFS